MRAHRHHHVQLLCPPHPVSTRHTPACPEHETVRIGVAGLGGCAVPCLPGMPTPPGCGHREALRDCDRASSAFGAPCSQRFSSGWRRRGERAGGALHVTCQAGAHTPRCRVGRVGADSGTYHDKILVRLAVAIHALLELLGCKIARLSAANQERGTLRESFFP